MTKGATPEPNSPANQNTSHIGLKRALSLPLLVLYGLGVTIGAGIYVLVGIIAGRAGLYAPFSFLFAAAVTAISAASFAELVGRYPVSAGEAAYVRHAFQSNSLSLMTGMFVIFTGVLSSAAISIGCAGYLMEFVAFPGTWLTSFVILLMGLIASWGITQSVLFAALFTIVEIAGLVTIIIGGFRLEAGLFADLPATLLSLDESVVWISIVGAGLLAFFAFIGFEDLVNLAEEAKRPKRDLPKAIFLTLIGSSLIYVLVAQVAVSSGDIEELASSSAPLSLVFERTTNFSPAIISLIAVFATLNGIVVQIIMASRVLYGLSRQGNLPAVFARIHPATRTPLFATAIVVVVILLLALLFPIDRLAEASSFVILLSFGMVNLALFKLKWTGVPAPDGIFTVNRWVPLIGFLVCVAFPLVQFFIL